MSSTLRASGAANIGERASRLLMNTYAHQPVTLVSGHGVWARDSDGRELIDMVAGIAVNVLGHAHPAVRRALEEQSAQLIHTSNLYYTEPQLELAELLVASAFDSRIALSSPPRTIFSQTLKRGTSASSCGTSSIPSRRAPAAVRRG